MGTSSSLQKSSAYRMNQARQQSELDTVNCCFCKRQVSERLYGDHLANCSKKPSDIALNCEFCGQIFKGNYDLYLQHIQTCQENPENTILPCDYCKVSYNLKILSTHVDNCGWNPRNMTITCEFCEIKIPFIEHENHLNTCQKHPNAVPISCEFCNAKLTIRTAGDHFKICRANPANIKIKCQYCGKKFNGIYYDQHVEECAKIDLQEGDNLEKECTICLIDIRPGDNIVFLGCAHKFHKKCAVDWAKKQKICPICRTEFQASEIFNPTAQ